MTTLPAVATSATPRWRLPRTALSPHPWQVLMAFMIAGFGIGLTQGGAASVIQDQVSDLNTSVEAIGYTMVAYALGVTVGAPLTMVGMGRVNRRTLLIGLSGLFLVTTIGTVIAQDIWQLFFVRFLSGLPHGAFLGTASYVAMMALGRERRGRAISMIMLGLTASAIVGVPGMQWISESYGWRVAYGTVAVVGVIALIGVWLFAPSIAGNRDTSVRTELSALRGRVLWTALIAITVGFAGFSAVFSYVVPILEDVNGFSSSAVTWILVLWGVGLTAGAALGGKLTDISPKRTGRVGLAATCLVLAGIAMFGDVGWAIVVLLPLLAASIQLFSQASQAHLMDVIHTSPSLGAAMSHSALNAANALGAGLGAMVIVIGWGYLAAAWVALALALVALVMLYRGAGYRAAS